jgi:hypothetical protein
VTIAHSIYLDHTSRDVGAETRAFSGLSPNITTVLNASPCRGAPCSEISGQAEKEDRGNGSMMKLLPQHRKNALLSKPVQERAPQLATALPIKGTNLRCIFV